MHTANRLAGFPLSMVLHNELLLGDEGRRLAQFPHLCLGTAFLAEATVILPSVQVEGLLLFRPLSS